MERRPLGLRGLSHEPEQLGGGRLVEPDLVCELEQPDRLEEPQRAESVHIGGVLGLLEAHRDVRLGAQVVDLVRLDGTDDAGEAGGVGQVAVVQEQSGSGVVRVGVDVVDALGVQLGRAPLDAVHLVTLGQQELGQVRPVLAGDPRDQRAFCHL